MTVGKSTNGRGTGKGHERSDIAKPSGKTAKGDIGSALRSVYEETTREKIPAEMLDLLGKLN